MHIATWMQTNSPAVVEIFCSLGTDFLVIDMEHSDLKLSDMSALMRAIPDQGDTCPLVRIESDEPLRIRQALDLGAAGVIVPMVETEEQASRIVQIAKYPPMGIRGSCHCRMNDWGQDFDAYQKAANDMLLTFVMIETELGLNNCESIIATEGVDGILIGSYDLSSSMGIPGEVSHPRMLEAERQLVDVCKSRGKTPGIHVYMPDEDRLLRVKEMGFEFIAVGGDIPLLRYAAKKFLDIAKNS